MLLVVAVEVEEEDGLFLIAIAHHVLGISLFSKMFKF
jgi:hypothetical protein